MALVTPVSSVRVLWRPEQFNRVSNPGFESNTSGWSASAGINAAGSAISRSTSNVISGTASGQVDCTTTDGSGVNFDFGSDRFYREADYGAIYVAVVWMRRISGSTRARIILGSEGTAADRATLTITDLVDAPRAYVVRWLPTANRTDVQLAITNGSAEELTVNIDDVAVYQVDAFSQVENGTFEVDTTGWSVSAGNFAAAATSITRTAGGFGGSYCGRLVTTASASSGVTFDLGGRKFTSGRTYRARIGVKTVSGSTGFTLHLGSPTSSDSATASVTAPAGWAWFTVDWTPAADRTNAEVAIYSSGTSVRTVDVDELEVYEAHDDLGTDAGDTTWSRSLDAIGSITCQVENMDGKYDPRNSSGALYGSVAPGKRILGRATYSNALHPLFFGTITTIEPNPFTPHADIVAEDAMGDLTRAQHGSRFYHDVTYAEARLRAIGGMLTRDPRNSSTTLGTSRVAATTAGLEGSCFFAGTDDLVPVGQYLADLNQATQAVHWIAPSVHANIGWVYTTVDRTTLTDTSSDFTVDEDFAGLSSVRTTHEALENQQVVPWQWFEMGPLPNDHFWDDGLDLVATAQDRETWASYGWLQEDDPYLHGTREEYTDNSDIPEPAYRLTRQWRRRRKGRKLVTRRRRIYPDAFVPFAMAEGDVRSITVDLALPMYDLRASVSGTDTTVRYVERSPQRITLEVSAAAATSVTAVFVLGIPYTPHDELEAQVTTGADAIEGSFAGPTLSTPYIPSAGAAEGVARFRNWRYGEALLRPVLQDHNEFPRTLTADLTDHITLSADRWHIDTLLFVTTGCRWSVKQGGLEWVVERDLEEITAHTAWFTLGTSELGGSDILAP